MKTALLGPDRFHELAENAGLQVFQRMGLPGRPGALLTHDAALPTPPRIRRRDLSPSTPEMVRLNRVAGEQQAVTADIHPNDFIYWFCTTHPHLSLEGGIHYYFSDGATSANKLSDLVAGLEELDQNSIKLLEFASGYGCVSRHLKKRSQFELVSCDIHPEAIEFLSGRIGVQALPSAHVPEQFTPPEKFDVVFALSFFSHMPVRTFGRWLKALFGVLCDPGYLVFTTLGLKACEDNGITPEAIPAGGLWFGSRSEQHDLDQAEYGMTIVTPEFVCAEVERQTGAPVVLHKPVGWWDNQDLWVVKREK